jgi:hypothetical protein
MCAPESPAFHDMRWLTIDEAECSDRLFSIALGDGERHRVAFNLTCELGWMAIRNFILAHRPAMLPDVRARHIKAALAVRNNLLVNSSVSAIILDPPTLRGDFKPDVLASPCACLRALHSISRHARLALHVSLLTRAIVCQKTYHKSNGKNNEIDFNGLAEHASCFNLIPPASQGNDALLASVFVACLLTTRRCRSLRHDCWTRPRACRVSGPA